MSRPPRRESRFHKGALIPLWVLQLVTLLLIILSGVIIGIHGWSGSNILMICVSSFCVILNFIEIIIFSGNNLKPAAYLVSQILKTSIWLGLFGFAMDSIVQWKAVDKKLGQPFSNEALMENLPVLIEPTVPLVFYFASLTYASIIYHRHRHRFTKPSNLSDLEQTPYHKSELSPTTMVGIATIPIELRSPVPFEMRGKLQELGDQLWVAELDKPKEVYELPATRTL